MQESVIFKELELNSLRMIFNKMNMETFLVNLKTMKPLTSYVTILMIDLGISGCLNSPGDANMQYAAKIKKAVAQIRREHLGHFL